MLDPDDELLWNSTSNHEFDDPTSNSRQGYYLPASRSGIIQSHRVMASSLMERAVRSSGSEMPTLSSVVVDFMKQLPVKDKPVKEMPFKTREGISPEDYEDVAEGLYNRSVNLQQKFEKKKGEDERESS